VTLYERTPAHTQIYFINRYPYNLKLLTTAYGFLYNAVANGYFGRVGPRGRGDTAYTLTEKGAEALAVAREILGTPSKTGKRGKRTRKSGTR